MEQLPSRLCTLSELQEAVQHPVVTRLLLQHVVQALKCGICAALKHWDPDVLQAALCEAARLDDTCLLQCFAAGVPQPDEADDNDALRRIRQYRCHVAEAALHSAAAAGSLAVLRLARPPASEYEGCHDDHFTPANQLLAPAVSAQQLQLVLSTAAIQHGQPAVLQLMLKMPPGRLAATYGFLLLEEAIEQDQAEAVRLVLAQCKEARNLWALQMAIRVPSPSCVQALLEAGTDPIVVQPEEDGRVLDLSADPYRCPVLVTLAENAREVRLPVVCDRCRTVGAAAANPAHVDGADR